MKVEILNSSDSGKIGFVRAITPKVYYLVFNKYFISGVVCCCKKDAVRRVNRMNKASGGRVWRFQRMLAADFR